MTDSSSADGAVEAAIEAAKEAISAESREFSDETQRRTDAALQAIADTASRTATAAMPCYRNFNSGLGPNEADGDRDDMSEFCRKPGYRACPACAAALTAGQGEGP